MTITVRPCLRRSSASTIADSGLRVYRARGSSRISTRLSFRKARASAMRCRWPPDSFTPAREPRFHSPAETLDELVCVGRLGRGDDLVAARTRRGVCDVVGDTAAENRTGSWRTTANWRRQVRELVLPQVDVVEQDLPLGRIVEAGEQADERGLAGRRWPPTMPSRVPCAISQETSCNTGRSGP